MALATAAKIGAEILPFILAAFAGGPEAVDPQATLRMLIAEFERALGPAGDFAVGQAGRAGAETGAALRQNVTSRVAKVGGGSTGTGAVVSGLVSSASTSESAKGSADARIRIAQIISTLASQSLRSATEAQTLTKPPTGFQQFTQGLAGVTAAEGNPFMGILNRILGESEAGESPISAEDFQKIMESPLIQPGGPGTKNFGTQGSELLFGAPPTRAGQFNNNF